MDSGIPSIKPFEGCNGIWVKAGNFPGSKSFGYFTCNFCQKNWISAHAFKGLKQGCK